MKPYRILILMTVSVILKPYQMLSQSGSEFKPKMEIGIDLLNYNRNWQYYNGNMLNPTNGKEFVLEAIPAIYIKIPLQKSTLRSKVEYFQSQYLFVSDAVSTIFQKIDGDFKETRILSGFEKTLFKNKSIKAYYLVDFALSVSNYKGQYEQSGDLYPSYDIHQFNINSIGMAIQPGLGVTFKIAKKFNLCIESSIFLGKGWDINDDFYINHENRFIPRPLSILGLSYNIGKQE